MLEIESVLNMLGLKPVGYADLTLHVLEQAAILPPQQGSCVLTELGLV